MEMWLLLGLPLLVAADGTSCCADVATMRDTVAELQRTVQRMSVSYDELVARLARLEGGPHHPTPPKQTVAPEAVRVDARGDVGVKNVGRRLTASLAPPEYLVVPALELHEFASGHTCPNAASGFKALKPVDASGAVTWAPTPFVPNATVSLGAVSNDWSVDDIQRFQAPLRVVHDASCAAPPSLELPLNTVVHGTFAVKNIYIGAYTSARILKCHGTTSGVAGKCARHDGTNYFMGNCNLDHDELQLTWYGKMIKSSRAGNNGVKCMHAQGSDGNVIASGCNNNDGDANTLVAAEMYWYWDGEQLKNEGHANNQCLQCGNPTDDANFDLRLGTCDGSEAQRFFYWFPGY